MSGSLKELQVQVLWDKKRRRNLPLHAPGFVYFIGNHDTGLIKIGYATDVEQRRRELQCGNAAVLETIATIPAWREDERRLHDALAHHRVRGEWFERDAVIALLAAGEMQLRCTLAAEMPICRGIGSC